MNMHLHSRSLTEQHSAKTQLFDRYFYRLVFVALSFLLILPLWVITYLPLGDLPDHAGQLNAITHYSDYKNDYRINWFTPYLVAYSISLFFGLFFSAVTALKITYTLAVLAVPLATASLIRSLGVNKYWVIPSFATAFSFSFYWGFFSFVVATPMAIGFFTFCVYYSQRRLDIKLFAIAAIFSALLFFAHAMAWAFSMAAAACIIFIYNSAQETKNKLLPFAALLPLVLYWVSINGATQNAHAAQPPVEFGHYFERISTRLGNEFSYVVDQFNERTQKSEHSRRLAELLSFSIGRLPLGDYVILSIILLVWPLLIGAKLTRNWRRWLPSLCAVGAFMLVPYWIFDTAYVNLRFAAFLLPLSLFLFDVDKSKNSLQHYGVLSYGLRCFLGVALTLVVLLGNYGLFASFKTNDKDFKAILEKMEPKKTVLALMFDQGSPLNITAPYMHYGSYYQAAKGGIALVNFSHDPVAHNVPLRFKGTPWALPDSWTPDKFDWQLHNGERYDYFLVRSHLLKNELFAESGGRVTLEARCGDWLLYKNNKAE
ncbi:MAG TPA: hypothetical protein VIZ65_05360 [Cellvibrionaceae bacterium]